MSRLQFLECGHQVVADMKRILLQALFLQHIQNREAGCAGDGIASEGRKKFHAIVKRRRNFRSGDHRRQGKSVADGFSQNNNVRNHLLSFKSPEVCAQAAKPDLNFIGNTYSTGCADVTINLRQIVGRKNNLSAHAGQRFRNIGSDAASLRSQAVKDIGDVARVSGAEVGFAPEIEATIIIRDWSDVDPGLAAASTGPVEFVRAYVNECAGMAVVSMLKNDDVFESGVHPRKPDSEFIGFASGIEEIANP